MKQTKIKQNSVNFQNQNWLSVQRPVSGKKTTLPYIKFVFYCVVIYC